jgi:hypothetical protein
MNKLNLNQRRGGMTEDDWGEDEYPDYRFNEILNELARTGEVIRMWEAEKENNNNNLIIESYD